MTNVTQKTAAKAFAVDYGCDVNANAHELN